MQEKLSAVFTVAKTKWKLIAIIVLVIAAGAYFITTSNASDEPELVFENPVQQSISKTLEVSGHVDAKQKARLRFIAGGKLTYVGALEGQTVKKWQTIATIDKQTLQKQLQQDLNLYMKERYDWEEVQDDIKEVPIATTTEERSVAKDQYDLTNTVLNVEIRDIAIQNSALYAPFEGVVTVAPTSVSGMQLLATDYFEIVDPKTLVFRAAVDESDIGQIKLGQTAELVLNAFEDTTVKTQVSYISYTSTETGSGTAFIVEFALSPEQLTDTSIANLLRIGMNGDINILLEEKTEVLTIPATALIQKDEKMFVMVEGTAGTLEEREVTVGLESDELAEITSGLSTSDKVMIPSVD